MIDLDRERLSRPRETFRTAECAVIHRNSSLRFGKWISWRVLKTTRTFQTVRPFFLHVRMHGLEKRAIWSRAQAPGMNNVVAERDFSDNGVCNHPSILQPWVQKIDFLEGAQDNYANCPNRSSLLLPCSKAWAWKESQLIKSAGAQDEWYRCRERLFGQRNLQTSINSPSLWFEEWVSWRTLKTTTRTLLTVRPFLFHVRMYI